MSTAYFVCLTPMIPPYLSPKFIFVASFFSLWLGAVHSRAAEISGAGTATGVPPPPGATVNSCANWQKPSAGKVLAFGSGPGYQASAEFKLPISSDKLFLIARGVAAGGVTVRQDGQTGDVARVEIVVQYRRFEDLQQVKVCACNQGRGENGVGIFGPKWSDPRSRGVSVAVYLHLPVSSEGSVLNVKNLETDMPMFTHNVDDLERGVYFSSISLKTTNMPINVGSVQAETAYMETVNAVITGSYKATSLTLITLNRKIDVTANLYNNKDAKNATVLKMHNANGSIRAQLNLVSNEQTSSAFAVAAATVNAGLDLTFLSAPVGSALALNASTVGSSAKVKLHKTYQGTFNLKTSLGRVSVDYDKRATDPTGKGRRRAVDVRQRGSSIEGSTTWSKEDLDLGSVFLQGSLASVTLTL